ncbi:Cytosine-specific DNA methyltransferase/Type II site-specific deoxyribonuclease [Metamycoplasma cloacale]|uniref:Cytosine-specific methyltransferase n=1 Tax=Metamycoplasma cloacale TaxID=92401 RepID=A0A2Z4LLT1_9BACT|nr:DNA cytosine methyltransferase [Metamycoplasma cloacale]AWX42741.1 DNA (cytosine-5-)-methyltransferase [Metamycoplasma cloacale]VEU79444.1 Cytosine-specific DNA methyltransferase/Type II site-specific deoxyribonuclease [Metamycoplasma cloacale]
MNKLKAASFFAGVGGIDLGFNDISELVYVNEFEKNAIKTFEANFDIKVDFRDIRDVLAEEIPDFDLLLAGFPCRAFSLAGYRQGFNDEKGRGNLFFELWRIFKHKKPSIIFLENVKNLVSHDNGRTFKVIVSFLEQEGYFVKYKVLNTMQYGNIPQNRERVYILAFKNKKLYENFEFPEPTSLTTQIKDLINLEENENLFYTSKFKHFDLLKQCMTNENTFYQWRRQYVRENKSNVCPTLTANMGTGGHNVPLILENNQIRKLSPRECFNFQGFPKNFVLPNIANSHLYKQAGNSVSVSVIKRIALKLKEAIERVEDE